MPVPTPPDFVPAIDCHSHAETDGRKPPANKKKIFVFCDGTGNEFADSRDGEGANSNVVKLYTVLRVAGNQVAYYHPGVGTMGDPSIRYALPRFWSKVKGLAFGNGFRDNVLDAYRYLMEVYNDGDDIYIFGFSRGAYTARALAGMLHGYGLLCRGNEGHLLYAWNMFHDAIKGKRQLLKKPKHQRAAEHAHSIQRNFSFAETFSRNVTVRFMGIWDTVSSVGWIYEPLRLLDMAQNPIIQVGRHAVSIDERRAYYRDNLWGAAVPIDHPEWPKALRDQGIQQDIAQVWFPGVHSDVGGSYPQGEAAPANEALRWMIGEVQRHGAELCHERIDMVLGTASGCYCADEIYTPAPKADHCLHESLKGVWWLLQLFPQQHYSKEDEKIQWRVPYSVPRTIPKGAMIHGSAVRRMDTPVKGEGPYRPRNLDRSHLNPLQPSASTTADVTGCFVYEPPTGKASPSDKTAARIAKLILGWITFVLFWAALGSIALCIVGAFFALLLLVLACVSRLPEMHSLIRWILSC